MALNCSDLKNHPALTEGDTFKNPLEYGVVRALIMAVSRGESAHISFKCFNLASSIFCERIRWLVPDRRSCNDISSSAASDIAASISGVMKLLAMTSTSGLTPLPASDKHFSIPHDKIHNHKKFC